MTFLTPAGYKATIPANIPHIDGSILVASARPQGFLDEQDPDVIRYNATLLLDPQLYLSDIDPNSCSVKCANLASYGWFDVGEMSKARSGGYRGVQRYQKKLQGSIADHWKGLPGADDVNAAVAISLTMQHEIGTHALIIPVPLIADRASDLSTELDWIDNGLAMRAEFDRPMFVTVAVSDRALAHTDAYENRLVDVLLDQVSAREPDGVYIVLELAGEPGYYLSNVNTLGALLRLADGFRRAGVPQITVNYATVAGLITLAAGADTVCTGWYLSERKVSLAGCVAKEEGATARPAYYSHRLAGEVHLASDMDVLVDKGHLDEIEDITPYSKDLIKALRKGEGVNAVPKWRSTPNNTQLARAHFSSVMAREAATIASLEPDERLTHVHDWLTAAQKLARRLNAYGDFHERTDLQHQRNWVKAFETFLDRR